ncbi:histidine kinase [Taibaiella lutea]|uniref:histidine kinase n=1 Tax=Taibaiella lutea TaxID=2608001 RepID=A0A5M6CLN1_9BACT|nr:7TM diverse intracellular signaling domain-containing protein [Taibaiella lutea]KAA5536128.1 histidine kinase [Taibaiella lutea]
MSKLLYCFVLCFLLSVNCFSAVIITDSLGRMPIGKSMSMLRSDKEIQFRDVLHSTKFEAIKTDIPNLGTEANGIWLKFDMNNRSNQNHFLLELAYPILDEVEIYIPDAAGNYTRKVLGESIPFKQRSYQYPNFILDINQPANTTYTYYIRVKSSEQIILPVYINVPIPLWEELDKQSIISGIYIGIVLIMGIYNLFLFFSVKDKGYVYYAIYVFLAGLTQIGIKGYTYKYLWPDLPYFESKSIVLFASLCAIAALFFARDFLQIKNNYPRINTFIKILVFTFVVSILLIFLNKDQAGFLLMQLATTVFLLSVFFISWFVMRKGYSPAKFFFIAWSALLAGSIIFLLKDTGILPYNNITSSSAQAASAIEMALLSFGLANRINIMKQEKDQSRLAALRIAKENSQIIKQQNVILEQKVKERTEELEQKNDTLNVAMNDLQEAQMQLVESEKMASLGQLTAGIAHEINNPINFVTGNIGPLKRDVGALLETIDMLETFSQDDSSKEEKARKIRQFKEDVDFDYLKTEISHLLKGIHEGASRTAEIVKSLRIFSRLDEDDIKQANLNEGLDSTLIIVNNMLNKINVIKEYDDLPLVNCYPGKLNQVFLNVISNGIYAIGEKFKEEEGGELKIITKLDHNQVLISISDNGTGMSAETKRKMFDPFYTTKDVGQGTGLGMSIAFNTIQKHDGNIQVDTEMGIGTTFNIILPIHELE